MAIKKRQNDFPRGKIRETKKFKVQDEFGDDVIISKRKKIFIEQINVKNIPIGTLILGCIQDIQDYELRVILPGCINCIIPITNISKEYIKLLRDFAENPIKSKRPLKPKSLFKIGQQVIVKVLNKKNEDFVIDETFIPYVNVRGTIDPEQIYEDVNPNIFLKSCKNFIISASVKSIEDHGYVMNVGINKLIGFLNKEKAKSILELLKLPLLSVGQVLCCAVLEIKDNIIQLSSNQLDLLNIRIDDRVRGDFPQSCLLPGLNVKAKVVDIQENGLEVLLFDEFPGFVLKDHLKSVWDLPENDYEIDSSINATILYQNINTKNVSLTLRSNYELNNLNRKWKVKIGQIFSKASVTSVNKKGTVIFRLTDSIKGIAPVNELSDDYMNLEDISTILHKYQINSKHEVRVKSFSYIDGYVKVTLKPSLLNIKGTPLDDIHLGSIIKGKVKQLNKDGLILRIGFAEKAFVPKIHLTENPMTNNLDKLFPLNKEVTGRIFRLDKSVDPPKICVTLKKSLLSSSLYILDSLDKVKPNVQTDGVICLIKDSGLLLEFFNRLRAWVSKVHVLNRDLSVYRVGQVVKATILKVEKEKFKIYATLINSNFEQTRE